MLPASGVITKRGNLMPYATSDGLRIHYELEADGQPLVLYHGLTGSGERWRDTGYTSGLGEGYRLILIDARGHGMSDKPHDPEAYGRRRQAADVVAVLDDLSIDSARFWGHSMGGDVVLTLGRHHPDRVRALVITGSPPKERKLPRWTPGPRIFREAWQTS